MVPKVEGAAGHPLRRPAARPAGGARGPERAAAGARDPGDRERRGERRGDRRRQPAHAGHLARPGRPGREPADEDHPGRRRASGLPGAHRPGRRRPDTRAAPPTSRTCGTTRSRGWSTRARRTGSCRTTGRSATSATWSRCEDQFRNAFLLGCVGAWSLHPAQIDIAKKVFSPEPEEVAWARRVIAEMGDGTGAVMIDGKMQDDASVKQCQVVAELADALAARDPELAEAYKEARSMRATPVRPVHAGRQRACAGEGEDAAGGRADPRPRGRGRPGREGGGPRTGLCAAVGFLW